MPTAIRSSIQRRPISDGDTGCKGWLDWHPERSVAGSDTGVAYGEGSFGVTAWSLGELESMVNSSVIQRSPEHFSDGIFHFSGVPYSFGSRLEVK